MNAPTPETTDTGTAESAKAANAPMGATGDSETPSTPRDGSGEMFDGIAKRYDLLNRMMSLGVDQAWRRKTVEALELKTANNSSPVTVLDVATGTGDLALLVAQMSPGSSVVGLDPSAGMLDVGRDKVRGKNFERRIELIQGDGQQLPFDDNSFDGVTIAFGIRNITDRAQALREMARVCKPGARVCILELTEPKDGIMGAISRFHMHTVAPNLGALLSQKRAYRYLPQSIAAFPPPEEFCDMMTAAGLQVLRTTPMKLGIAHLYVGTPNQPEA